MNGFCEFFIALNLGVIPEWPRKNRLPVEVVKIPLSGPLTQAFEDARDRIIAAEMPKQLGYALKQQLRLWLTR